MVDIDVRPLSSCPLAMLSRIVCRTGIPYLSCRSAGCRDVLKFPILNPMMMRKWHRNAGDCIKKIL